VLLEIQSAITPSVPLGDIAIAAMSHILGTTFRRMMGDNNTGLPSDLAKPGEASPTREIKNLQYSKVTKNCSLEI
jgi:hypothetical protein